MHKINIRGVMFDNVTLAEAEKQAILFMQNRDKSAPDIIYTPNSEIVQACVENPALFEIINSASMIIPDGAGVVLASKILGTPVKEKVAGADLSLKIIAHLAEEGGKLFLLGAKQEILEKALENLKAKHPNLLLDGHQGWFDKNDDSANEKVINQINNFSPDAVFVCFGAPAQEKWIYANKEKINAGLLIGLGGMIDDYAGVVKRAPKIMRKNFEWLYRLAKQPRKRIGRMMKIPKFLLGCAVHKRSGG